MTNLTLGSGVGGVGVGALSLLGTLTLGDATDSGESLNYNLTNPNSPCYVQEIDLVAGANIITIPPRAGGVVIMPSTDADFSAYLKGVATDSISVILNKAAPNVFSFPTELAIAVTCVNATERINYTAHPYVAGDRVKFSFAAGGALPAGITANTIYYVVSPAANDFQVSLTPGGAAVNLTSDGTSVLILQGAYNFVLLWPGYGKLDVPVTADNATEKIALTAHGMNNGDRVKFRAPGGSVPGGLTEDVLYYIVNKTANDFQLSSSSGGSVIDITSTGSNVKLSTVDKFKFFWF